MQAGVGLLNLGKRCSGICRDFARRGGGILEHRKQYAIFSVDAHVLVSDIVHFGDVGDISKTDFAYAIDVGEQKRAQVGNGRDVVAYTQQPLIVRAAIKIAGRHRKILGLDNSRKCFFVHQSIDIRLGKSLFTRAFVLRTGIRQLLLVGVDGLLGAGKLGTGASELRCCGNGTRLNFGKLLLVGFEFSRCRLRLLRKLPDLCLNLRVCAVGVDGF